MMTNQAAIDAGVAAIQGLRDLMWDRVQHGVMRNADDEDWVERVIAAVKPHLRQALAEELLSDDDRVFEMARAIRASPPPFYLYYEDRTLYEADVRRKAREALRAALDVQEPEA